MTPPNPSYPTSSASPADGVSVIIPTRNRARLLERAINCALRQRDVRVDVVIVDDASTDATAAILSAWDDDRLTVVRNEVRRGVTGVRNQGLARAKEPWVAFLDDDDVWAPTKLARQLAEARRTRSGWCWTG